MMTPQELEDRLDRIERRLARLEHNATVGRMGPGIDPYRAEREELNRRILPGLAETNALPKNIVGSNFDKLFRDE